MRNDSHRWNERGSVCLRQQQLLLTTSQLELGLCTSYRRDSPTALCVLGEYFPESNPLEIKKKYIKNKINNSALSKTGRAGLGKLNSTAAMHSAGRRGEIPESGEECWRHQGRRCQWSNSPSCEAQAAPPEPCWLEQGCSILPAPSAAFLKRSPKT